MQRAKYPSWERALEGIGSSATNSRDAQPVGPDAAHAEADTRAHSHPPPTPASAEHMVEAFSGVYERHLPRVYGYLRSRTGNDEDAADLTQQTFVQALHALPRYTDRGVPVEVWLLRIARNLAVAAHRHRARHGGRTVELDLLPQALQPLAEDMEEPESAALLKEARTRLRALLAQLDPDKRELLVLRFVSRLTAREIGLVVGKSEQAVQKQLTRTLHALKERYDED